MLTGATLLVRHGVHTVISFTAHGGIYRAFPHVARIAQRLGVDAVGADRLTPIGQGGIMHDLVLSPPETREFVEIVAGAARRRFWQRGKRTQVRVQRALQFLAGSSHAYHCTAGASLLTLLSNGALVPCRRMPIRVGNVLRTSLVDLYRNSEVLRALRMRHRLIAGCEQCTHRRHCRGGLRCLSYAIHGDSFHADPGCWLAATRQSGVSPDEVVRLVTQGHAR